MQNKGYINVKRGLNATENVTTISPLILTVRWMTVTFIEIIYSLWYDTLRNENWDV